MLTGLLAIPLTLAIAAVIFSVIDYRRALKEWSVPRKAICPRDGQPVDVKVDARAAARTAAIGIPIHVRLADCTLWPERAGCDQRCLRKVAPTHTAVVAKPA